MVSAYLAENVIVWLVLIQNILRVFVVWVASEFSGAAHQRWSKELGSQWLTCRSPGGHGMKLGALPA